MYCIRSTFLRASFDATTGLIIYYCIIICTDYIYYILYIYYIFTNAGHGHTYMFHARNAGRFSLYTRPFNATLPLPSASATASSCNCAKIAVESRRERERTASASIGKKKKQKRKGRDPRQMRARREFWRGSGDTP